MTGKQIEKLVTSLNSGEVKALDEACQKQLTAMKGDVTENFMILAKEFCVCAVRRGLRNPY